MCRNISRNSLHRALQGVRRCRRRPFSRDAGRSRVRVAPVSHNTQQQLLLLWRDLVRMPQAVECFGIRVPEVASARSRCPTSSAPARTRLEPCVSVATGPRRDTPPATTSAPLLTLTATFGYCASESSSSRRANGSPASSCAPCGWAIPRWSTISWRSGLLRATTSAASTRPETASITGRPRWCAVENTGWWAPCARRSKPLRATAHATRTAATSGRSPYRSTSASGYARSRSTWVTVLKRSGWRDVASTA